MSNVATKSMTFGLVADEKKKPKFDSTRYYDPERHPMRRLTSGKLFTIDRGSRFRGEYRYWGATDGVGSDGVAGKIATLVSSGSGYNSFSRIYDEAERICNGLRPNETAFIRGLSVTRVR